MKRNLLCTLSALILLSTTLSAQNVATDFEVSVFKGFRTLPANTNLQSQTTTSVHTLFPSWIVRTDKLNGLFTDLYGTPFTPDGNNNTERSLQCMTGKLKTLGVQESQWFIVSAPSAPRADYVNYTQRVNGHPVVFSWLSFRFTKSGELARIQMRNYGDSYTASAPSVSRDAAKSFAMTGLNDISTTSAVIDADWSWFPVPTENGYQLHPSWHFRIEGTVAGQPPLILTGYIDGVSGKILYRTNEVKETGYNLTVKGMVYKNGTTNPATLEPLPDLDLNIATSTYFTDTAGSYSDASILLPATTNIPLKGKWSVVIDSSSHQIPLFSTLVSAVGTTYTYPATTPCSDRDINAYYHVNRVHAYMKSLFPSFTGMDTALPTKVDLTSGSCNAFYNGRAINFYAASATCHSYAEMGDVIYHEYGHGISDHFYTSVSGSTIMNGALNEACSDVWAMCITHDPVLAKNAYVTYGGFIRRYDLMPQVYPIDLQNIDPHKDGQIIAGTWWDVGVNIGNVDTMARLFSDVYYDVPDGPMGSEGTIYQTILVDALMADDNNGNLADGTPHYNQIVAAFAKHGIYLEGDANILNNEPNDAQAGLPITITPAISIGDGTYEHDFTMYYRLNDTGSWTSVVMTPTGPNFTGTIPAQPLGTTVEYYFIVHDPLGQPNVFFPIGCNPALPSGQQNLPYQFGVGITKVDSVDFESSPSGWTIGHATGDNATGSLWHRGTPVANYYYNSWPAGDHTHGSGSCLVTGDGSIGTFGSTVHNGSSSVITPVFDISGFTTPVVEYYRWFSNEQDLDNYKDDPWIVKISAGTSTWYTVENTRQGDDRWRRRIFPVSAYLPAGSAQLQLRFFCSDSLVSTWNLNGQGTTVGGIDDFAIYDQGYREGVKNVDLPKATVYPDPADDKVFITLQNYNGGNIQLYDLQGRMISSLPITPNNSTYSIATKDFSAGLYNMVISTGKNIQVKKIIVTH